MADNELILMCAVRYALGRMSYIVGVVAEYVALKRYELSEQCRHLIIRDIEEELERYHRAGQTLGMEYDERTWCNLLTVLKEVENDKENSDIPDPTKTRIEEI